MPHVHQLYGMIQMRARPTRQKKGVTHMKDQKLTEQQKKDIDLLSKLPKETQENLISYAAGMIAAQQILSRPQTA